MNLWQEYKKPTSIPEAIQTLVASTPPVLPIAGGTDLMLDLKQGRHPPVHTLVDLTFIPEMKALERRGDFLFIGAALSVNQAANHPLTIQYAQALSEAGNLIAGPQVRNTATLGGNVAHALPAADGTIALTALDARAEVAGKDGNRFIPFTQLFLGPGKSALNKNEEIIVGFHLPIANRPFASCFKRIMRPQGVALPILNCAVWLTREENRVGEIRVAVGPGASVPFRASAVEDSLRGQPLNDETFARALDALLEQARFRDSARRASAEYRRRIVQGLFRDVLYTAWGRVEERN